MSQTVKENMSHTRKQKKDNKIKCLKMKIKISKMKITQNSYWQIRHYSKKLVKLKTE